MNEFEHGECPSCGSALRLIEGQYSLFLGCSNYPNCRFTENIGGGVPKKDYGNCPLCGHPLVKKEGVRMIFCSKAGCRYIRLW